MFPNPKPLRVFLKKGWCPMAEENVNVNVNETAAPVEAPADSKKAPKTKKAKPERGPGRPPVYKGNQIARMVSLAKKLGAKGAVDAIRGEVAEGSNFWPADCKISVPTVIKAAKAAGVSFQPGRRPSKPERPEKKEKTKKTVATVEVSAPAEPAPAAESTPATTDTI